jgi:hypothetical protein
MRGILKPPLIPPYQGGDYFLPLDKGGRGGFKGAHRVPVQPKG